MEINISQDIRKYKTKDVGNFSFKEMGFIVLGCSTAYITYKISGSMETAMIPMLIILIFGFFKPYGLTFTQFLRTVVKESVSPKIYIDETDFVYDFEEQKKLWGDEYDFYAETSIQDDYSALKINKEQHKREEALRIK